jgi:hypothetical protein
LVVLRILAELVILLFGVTGKARHERKEMEDRNKDKKIGLHVFLLITVIYFLAYIHGCSVKLILSHYRP